MAATKKIQNCVGLSLIKGTKKLKVIKYTNVLILIQTALIQTKSKYKRALERNSSNNVFDSLHRRPVKEVMTTHLSTIFMKQEYYRMFVQRRNRQDTPTSKALGTKTLVR